MTADIQRIFLAATSNTHKLSEIQVVFCAFPPVELSLVSFNDIRLEVPEPVEDQPTFEGNAILKAKYYANASKLTCLADDSGLEVDLLHGHPGVKSVRYAGISGTRNLVDSKNNTLPLRNLGNAPREDRSARFVCAMAVCSPGNDEPLALVRGSVEGRILGPGDEGFQCIDSCQMEFHSILSPEAVLRRASGRGGRRGLNKVFLSCRSAVVVCTEVIGQRRAQDDGRRLSCEAAVLMSGASGSGLA